MSEMILSNEFQLVVPDWNETKMKALLNDAAHLVYESFPEFYDLFSDNQDAIIERIASQLKEPMSEIGISRILVRNNEVAGLYTYLPSNEVNRRRCVSLRHLLGMRNLRADVHKQIAEFGKGIEPVPKDNILWTRLSISKKLRGLGLGRLLSKQLINEIQTKGYNKLYSHVNVNHAPSIAMHHFLGFRRFSENDFTHVIYILDLS